MAETADRRITFHFTTPVPTHVLTGQGFGPITISLTGLDQSQIDEMMESGNCYSMASLMSADGRVPMASFEFNIFGGDVFAEPIREGGNVTFRFNGFVIRQSGHFRIQFALLKTIRGGDHESSAARAPFVPLSRHTEVIHVSAFVHESRGE